MSRASLPGSIRAWEPEHGGEPFLRVGIVLDQDAFDAVHLRVPGRRYWLSGPGESARHLEPHTEVIVGRAAQGLSVQIGAEPGGLAATVRLGPVEPQPLEPGAGVLVHGVVAGRGFHWQKRIDQTLSGTLELLWGERGVVLVAELPLEEYLAGVTTAEMSGACPGDLLKAQCIVARSWLLALTETKHDSDPFDRCNDDCCQRYQGTGDLNPAALEAVRATRGLVLVAPTGDVLDANYSKSCGGISELPRHVWDVDKPGISAVVDAPRGADEHRFLPVTDANLDEFLDGAWLDTTQVYCSPRAVPVAELEQYLGRVDEVGNYFRWTVRYERAELEQMLIEKLPGARDLAVLRDLRVTRRGVSGRASAAVVEWEDKRGQIVRARLSTEYRIRAVLHRKFLYSSAFAVRPERDADGKLIAIALRGAGWGHGVGLCQIGALGMALAGIDFEAICRHYYPEAKLATVYT